MAIAMEAEIVGDTDKMELLSDRLLELSFVVEEVIHWPEPCSDCATIVAVAFTDLEPEAFFHHVNAIIDPYDTSPGAATLMHVAPIDRPILVSRPRVLKRRFPTGF